MPFVFIKLGFECLEKTLGEAFLLEIEVIFLICDVKKIFFAMVIFFINKPRNMCLKQICFFPFLLITLAFYYYHFQGVFCVTPKPGLNILLSKCAIVSF